MTDPLEPTQAPEVDARLGMRAESYRALVQNSSDVLILLGSDGVAKYVSPSCVEIFGREPEEVIGSSPGQLVHPDDVEELRVKLAPLIYTPDGQLQVTFRALHADGSVRWIEAACRNLAEDPAVGSVVCSFRDVTDRKLADQERRATSERLRVVLESSRDVIALLDLDGHIVWGSPSIVAMLGGDPESYLARDGFDLVHEDDREVARAYFEKVMSDHTTLDPINMRLVRDDGTWIDAEIAAAPWATDGDGARGVILNIRDVTWRREAEEALRRSEEIFRSLAQSSPMGIFRDDLEGNCLYVNDRWQEITGYSAEEAMGKGWLRTLHPDDATIATDGDVESAEFRVVRPNGEIRWVSLRASALLDDAGETTGKIGALEDVTDRIEAQRDSQRLTDIFEATHDIVAIADTSGHVVYLNRFARGFFGLSERAGHELLADFDLLSHLSADTLERLITEIQPVIARDGMWTGEIPVVRSDGVAIPHLAQLLCHRNDDGKIEFYSCVMHDISERKAFEFRLAHQATHDPLTGLPNRTLLLDRLEMALSRARRHQRRVAVLFLDLDHFKVVNDSLGHGLGDRLLVEIAGRLKIALRPDDTVARFGGDEFVVLCEDLVNQQDAIAIAERIDEAISGPFVVDDAEVFVGVSIGIAFPDNTEADPETLIRDADAAMYQAKDRGRARWVVFDNVMRASVVDRLDIENALRRALDRRELRVHYQPIIDLRSGVIESVEALLRWEHPQRGLLLPGDFIAIAEETGLIVPIGTWVLDQACRQVQRWQVSHPELPRLMLSVNLSGRQLGHPSLVEDVAVVIDDTGIDPSLVELEITESVLMDDVEMSHDTLGRLKEIGVKLAVDDFGTGYSSLSYLRRFPVDLLKVDRSFIRGLGSDPGDSAIVTAIVTLAHTLGLEAVAEGVETAEQLSELRHLSCDRAQGFLIARPAAGPDLEALLESGLRW